MTTAFRPRTEPAPNALGRTPFPLAGLPAPEPAGQRRWTQLVTALGLAAGLAYLVWRAAGTVDLHVWWVSVPLLLLEVHALVGLALFATSLWNLDAAPPAPPVTGTALRIAVLIPTFNEPVEVLLPTIAAAVQVRLPHETWVLDDGDRAPVRALAERLGARYLARPTHEHAKAGNVNHALGHLDVDLIAVLDADHVADPDLLVHTVGYFDDPRLALVQTPQDFYNLDSFEHSGPFNEQQLFYRAIQPGRNRWGAAFWCGTGAVVRVAALREVGGLATETVTEDIHTTIRLHRAGWRTVCHNEVLARGLAAGDAMQYLNQRLRWGTGAMQVLRCENPAWVPGLRPMQRVSYLATLLGWFDAWRSLGYLLVPIAVLATGAAPLRASFAVFGPVFAINFLLQRYVLARLSRGLAPQGLAVVFELVRMPANLQATLRLLSRRSRPFSVTAKGRMGSERAPMPVPLLLRLLLAASVLAAGWAGLTFAGLTPLHYGVRWAAWGALFWLAVNGVLLGAAVRRIGAQRFGAERRASVRFDLAGTGLLGEQPVQLADASLTGARVLLPFDTADPPAVGDELPLRVGQGMPVLWALVRSSRQVPVLGRPGTYVVGLEFLPGQELARAQLALALFGSGVSPELVAAPSS